MTSKVIVHRLRRAILQCDELAVSSHAFAGEVTAVIFDLKSSKTAVCQWSREIFKMNSNSVKIWH
jgi:hypothetical protein